MDFSTDDLRRDLRDSRDEQRAAMGSMRELLARVFSGDEHLAADQKADLLLGGVARRRFLKIGGLSVATAAVLAACGRPSRDEVPQTGDAPTLETIPSRSIDDVVLLRTASSLEHTAIDTYEAALGLGVLPAEVADVAKLFQSQHREHAKLIEQTTASIGGEPYTTSNPVVQAQVDTVVASIVEAGGKPEDIIALAYVLETVAAETYQTVVPVLTVPALREGAMRIGGVEARHSAVIAKLMPNSAVVPLLGGAGEATAETTTTVAATTETTAAGVEYPPIYQVPSAFQPLTSVTAVIAGEQVSMDPLGPNSFVYADSE